MLRSFVGANPEDWDLYMTNVEFAINDSRSDVNGFTPFELCYGHEGEIRAFRERQKEINAQIDTEAAAQKKQKKEEIERSLEGGQSATAVANPDGSVYRQHQLLIDEWNIVRESMYILHYAKIAVDMLQSTQTVTSNLFLAVGGRLAYTCHADTTLMFEGKPVQITNEHVKAARELMYTNCCKRFFNDLIPCKLEDFAVATCLDPHLKNFRFKYVERWRHGTFTAQMGVAWAKKGLRGELETQAKPRGCILNGEKGKPRAVVHRESFLTDSDDEEDDLQVACEQADPQVEEDEFQRYMLLPEVRKEVSVQEWWRKHAYESPTLSKMARQFLAAPASTAEKVMDRTLCRKLGKRWHGPVPVLECFYSDLQADLAEADRGAPVA
ncbi:hypothetical protein CYMTET_15432 [Cymbomonas tetramitiformis]|uniref:HAT C-terminal dimerisation domain-containing protein n=1 Tax=Cymbomonas tetramitiformis TaxID=36881 RepID=A0AAE0GEC1_9CHLO|nr:hypothetical protein CYMTET_15432 [Cymbomonas tetramitiformis]